MHGKFKINVQRFKQEGEKDKSYFDLTNQFQDEYISARLQEFCGYYSNRLSYEGVEELVRRLTGFKLLSDQKLREIVIKKAVKASREEEKKMEIVKRAEELEIPAINPKVNIYDPYEKEVLLFEDGIQVKKQKLERERKTETNQVKDLNSEFNDEKVKKPKKKVTTDIIMLEKKSGEFEYLMSAINEEGKELVSLEDIVRSKLIREYGKEENPLNIVAIVDGAKNIHLRLLRIFGVVITIILDWYHLCKKLRELMSMIARNKKERLRHLKFLFNHLWRGKSQEVLTYLRTEVIARNQGKLSELITYIEKHKPEIIDYKSRKEAGKTIGSGRMEKGVDQVIGFRQKKKGMSWSKIGSHSLGILKIAELNNKWEELWFQNYPDNYNSKTSSLLQAA